MSAVASSVIGARPASALALLIRLSIFWRPLSERTKLSGFGADVVASVVVVTGAVVVAAVVVVTAGVVVAAVVVAAVVVDAVVAAVVVITAVVVVVTAVVVLVSLSVTEAVSSVTDAEGSANGTAVSVVSSSISSAEIAVVVSSADRSGELLISIVKRSVRFMQPLNKTANPISKAISLSFFI